MKTSDNINVSYKYDENGIRAQKVVNGVQTDFITSGIKVLAQKSGNNTIVWQVDGNGNTVGFNYNGTPYFYMKNLQGDIIAITDISGNTVAKYTYDSWGKLISIKDSSEVDKTDDTTFIGYINPLRYRGYYYDTETGLYYLNARYYDPEVGRFISTDETLSGGYNLFEYCYNDPTNFVDYDGAVPVNYMICIGSYCHFPGVPPRKPLPPDQREYNCWGWVRQKITGIFKEVNPRNFDHGNCSLDNLSRWIMGDLQASGQEAEILGALDDNQLATAIARLAKNEYLIAIRVGAEHQYYCMRYDNGAWTHKFGPYGYLYRLLGVTPNDDRVWRDHSGRLLDGTVSITNPFNPYAGSNTIYIKSTFLRKSGCTIV